MSSARRGTAPCGHPGTYVLPNFITCDQRCGMASGEVPKHVDPERTLPFCPHCGAGETQIYQGMSLDPEVELWHCRRCMKAFLA
jgi:hypothetical protein